MNDFPDIRFARQLRPSQIDMIDMARGQLSQGERQLHIVAPPGSGKTVLGLFLWAECIRVPALVLSPNSAIQAQWVERLSLFDGVEDLRALASLNPESPGLLTSLTYQAVTLPHRGNKELDDEALELWIERLVEQGEAQDPDEAEVWIEDLKRHNRSYYEQRLSSYRKEIRDELAIGGQALKTLHASAIRTLERLKQAGVGLLILDECHHLLSHWGRVLSEAHQYFGNPIVLGLTATPPDMRGKPAEDIERYRNFFGPIDYEIPVPAVVKDGFLAPYQDLVQFVRPTAEELDYIARADDELFQLTEQLCQPVSDISRRTASPGQPNHNETASEETDPCAESIPLSSIAQEGTGIPDLMADASQEQETFLEPGNSTTETGQTGRARESLTEWLWRVLAERSLPTGKADDWQGFAKRDPGLAWAGPRFLQARGLPFPPGVPEPMEDPDSLSLEESRSSTRGQRMPLEVLIPVLSRYIRHRLRRSSDPADQQLADAVTRRLRMLGTQITATGHQACASPIARVMAYARGKTEAIVPILKAEHSVLQDRLRAVVVADYEKTSAVTADIRHLLDEEAGGAIAAFRTLLRHPETDALDPILVTGSSVLVDDDLARRVKTAATDWLAASGYRVDLEFTEVDGFHQLNGRGADWCPRVYVSMITELFQQGITKCLVGTRGLLGEGWDASKINVLIDLTTVTTSTSVNQLRGRSLRLDPDDPRKLAHNWDIVCIAPEFTKGLDDYRRFKEKHNTIFGVTDNGLIEKGVGHVHAAFTEWKPEFVEGAMHVINAEMLERTGQRDNVRKLWRIGEPYCSEPIHALELLPSSGEGRMAPFPYAQPTAAWNPHSLVLAIGRAVLGALQQAGLLQEHGELFVDQRAGGYLRTFLKGATAQESKLFHDALGEAVGPFRQPRYVIRRWVDYRVETWISRLLPEILGRYFQRERRHMQMLHAVPKVLAKNKELALIYARHWNRHVSPGQPVYVYSEEGQQLLQLARETKALPRVRIHQKEVFM